MALTVTVKAGVDKAFTAAGDFISSVNYVVAGPGSYNPVTDTTTTTATTYSAVRCALVKLKDDEVSWFPADSIMQKALIPYNALPITPVVEDYLVIDGVTWQITKITPVPGRVVHILYVRKT